MKNGLYLKKQANIKKRKQKHKQTALRTTTLYSTQLTIMTVLSGVPLELAETEAVEVQIVLLMTAKQKVCSCI